MSASISFRITIVSPGFYLTWISDNEGETFEAITNGVGVIHYGEFEEALAAIQEHWQEM